VHAALYWNFLASYDVPRRFYIQLRVVGGVYGSGRIDVHLCVVGTTASYLPSMWRDLVPNLLFRRNGERTSARVNVLSEAVP
jgi:hypothetical protein